MQAPLFAAEMLGLKALNRSFLPNYLPNGSWETRKLFHQPFSWKGLDWGEGGTVIVEGTLYWEGWEQSDIRA